MLAEASSELDAEDNVLPAQSTTTTQPHGRKRKRAAAAPPQSAASPAPSDPGSSSNGLTAPELITSRVDLTSRPQLSISRGPHFIPISEGSPYFKTDFIGVNRVGFRYVPAGINPPGHILPCRTIESNPTSYRISWEDRSPFITVTKDGLGLRGCTGFRSARCNAPISEGKWFMEVKIIHGGGEHYCPENSGRREGSHVRLGWGRREAPLNAPVGLDGYSYGYRDKTGDKVTLSRPRPYGKPFGTGDVIGMYISLPPYPEPEKNDPHDPAHIKRERIPIDLKGQEVFEILEYPQSKEMTSLMDYSSKTTNSSSVPSGPKKASSGAVAAGGKRGGPNAGPPSHPNRSNAANAPPSSGTSPSSSSPHQQNPSIPTLPGSRVAFFINGECQGTAFQDIFSYLQPRQTDTQRNKAKEKERKRTREGVKEHRENPFNDGWLGYYPFVSLFNDACVMLNPGPEFEFGPPDDIDALLDGKKEEEEEEAGVNGNENNGNGSGRKWRPMCERYPEFMTEQWALDAREEEEARAEAARIAAHEEAEAAKKAERSKKRQLAEARKKAKLAAADEYAQLFQQNQQQKAASLLDEERFGPNAFGLVPSPSPLRHGTTFSYDDEYDDGKERDNGDGEVELLGPGADVEVEVDVETTGSPGPLAFSVSAEPELEPEQEQEQELFDQSGYTSEAVDIEMEHESEHEEIGNRQEEEEEEELVEHEEEEQEEEDEREEEAPKRERYLSHIKNNVHDMNMP